LYTTFWAEYRLWGAAPLGYHLVNVLLHGVNGVLVWRILRAGKIPGAWPAAAIFVLHPVHVESVAWVIERKDVLSAFFYLLAFLSFLRFDARKERWAYGAALILVVCAMLSKSIAATFPVALLLWFWWKRERLTRRDILHIVPFLTLAAILGMLDLHIAHHRDTVRLGFSWLERGLIASRALVFYAGKLAAPIGLVTRGIRDPAS